MYIELQMLKWDSWEQQWNTLGWAVKETETLWNKKTEATEFSMLIECKETYLPDY